MKTTSLLSLVAFSTALSFAACSSDDENPGGGADAGGSSSSGSSGASSSSGETSSSGGGSSSSSSSSSSGAVDAGSDASTCTAAAATAATEQLALAVTHAREFLDAAACESENYPVDVAEDVQRAIDSCADARAAFANESANEDARTVLEGTVTLGMLAGKPFAEALVGATIRSDRPEASDPTYALRFTDGTRVVSTECVQNADEEDECVDRNGSYEVIVAGTEITITLDFLTAPRTPDSLRVVQLPAIAAPAFVFEADGQFEDAYSFEDLECD